MTNSTAAANALSRPPISILACGGSLPLEIAETLQRDGHTPNIVTIAGMADADFGDFPLTSVKIGHINALLNALRANGARDMLIAGHARRPDLKRITIDRGFIRHIFTILALTRGGDDNVLRKVAAFFESNGLNVRGIADLAPELLTPQGTINGTQNTTIENIAQQGLHLVHRLGPFDVGQALVMEHGKVAAIEGAEGTNGLLSRLKPAEKHSTPTNERILIKAAKPEQDLRLDLPTIGPETIDRCVATGVRTIALEAGRSLIVSRNITIQKAHEANVTLIGLESGALKPRANQAHPSMRLITHARARPAAGSNRDATKGLQLLASLPESTAARAAVVARENVLALNLDESMPEFIERSEKIVQWGDRREKGKRNRTLVLHDLGDLAPEFLINALAATKISGIALLSTDGSTSDLDRLITVANTLKIFVLSAK